MTLGHAPPGGPEDAQVIEAGESLGLSRWGRVRHVVRPGALPGVLTGLRHRLGLARLRKAAAATASDVHRPVTGQAVHVAGLTRRFDGRAVLDKLHLDVRPGEFVALLGRSGSGKSTLLRVLAGLDRDIEGTVLVPRRRAIAFRAFQAAGPMPWKRVWRTVLLGLASRAGRPVAGRASEEVGPGHRAAARPKTRSGGETQHASLARALVRDPDLLLLDEPFGALDALTRVTARRLVEEVWRRRGCAVLLVTHDVEEAVLLADRVLVMDGGVIAHERRIDLGRPRDTADPRFAELCAGLLKRLAVSTATESG